MAQLKRTDKNVEVKEVDTNEEVRSILSLKNARFSVK